VSPNAAAQLARAPLFDGVRDAELFELTSPWSAARGDVLFRQGDPGDRLLLLTSGALEVCARFATGGERSFATIAPGEIVGELALLAGGRRAASVRAVSDSAGVALARETFELLRLQPKPAARTVVQRIGEVALRRLLARYVALAADLGGGEQSAVSTETAPAGGIASGAFSANGVPDSYLRQILFFRRFTTAEIAAVREGLRVLNDPRGTRIDTRERLWIVLRGAVQTSICHRTMRQRLRVAGPGRCVGQLGLLPAQDHAPVLETMVRERAVLLEVPHARAHALLAGDAPGAQRFAEALHEDVVQALLAVEAPRVESRTGLTTRAA
jgi:CRP-like cAMP-binding protein